MVQQIIVSRLECVTDMPFKKKFKCIGLSIARFSVSIWHVIDMQKLTLACI